MDNDVQRLCKAIININLSVVSCGNTNNGRRISSVMATFFTKNEIIAKFKTE